MGCGPGQLSLYLTPLVDHLTAVDIDAQTVGYLKRTAQLRELINIDFRVFAAEELQDVLVVVIMSTLVHCLLLWNTVFL
ncbi:MAG: methyltransferase domain-containing protein [Fastidiosipilaceae bacterium]|nr:methyltransferase domain-containing protein [Clostridiaceae bacterium]